MSKPGGFGHKLKMFLSPKVNCTTIDWFAEWPAEALYNVAKQQLGGGETDGQETVASSISNLDDTLNCFKLMHMTVQAMTKVFFLEMKRRAYVTPTSYLELLSTFKNVLQQKRKQVGVLIHRFQSGLDKLASAEEQVAVMEKELTELQPVLEKTSKEVAELMIVIQRDKQG